MSINDNTNSGMSSTKLDLINRLRVLASLHHVEETQVREDTQSLSLQVEELPFLLLPPLEYNSNTTVDPTPSGKISKPGNKTSYHDPTQYLVNRELAINNNNNNVINASNDKQLVHDLNQTISGLEFADIPHVNVL